MSTILEHPQAQELLAQTEVEPETVCHCRRRLTRFVQRYLPCFYRDEHRQHAQIILQGKLTGLQRKTTEPIAIEADLKRRPLQHFVGAGGWQDDAVLAELRRHVGEELGQADGVLVLDPSAFPKKGIESCGVARQWCGRLGKVDNCQVGVFLAYVASRGQTLVDGRLFFPTTGPPTQSTASRPTFPRRSPSPRSGGSVWTWYGPPARNWRMAGSSATTSSVA